MILSDLTPDSVLRLLAHHQARRMAPPSLAGMEPDIPRSTAPPRGDYELLLWLTIGVSAPLIRANYEHWTGWVGHKRVTRLVREGLEVDDTIAMGPPIASILQRGGMDRGLARRAVIEARATIAENIGRLKRWVREDQDMAIRRLAREVIG